ncbi:carotenoid oxygenase family protein [Actinocorallia sp. A-T 12471]|uniref:carotenoid oxygenase family protein n=1 Tax=Actinocorallia sp. A-T 12471 TaxID=3089813 RepID=UPI0029CB9487|nr:carotenoid oxygenase family protein [Actinocorallia sp. A-T 12471]MDX6738855.1 carotenoid oxygenase family protein [Actinocorallia sp. A-T 12471]
MPIPRSILAKDDPADLDLTVVSGTWPSDVGGHFVVSSADQRTHPIHAFFGDGILVRMPLRPDADGVFPWRPRLVETPSVLLRRACPDLFVAGPVGTSSPFGMVNAANTAPLPWGDRLFATWDAGRPVEVDPVTLDFLGEVGHRDDWAPALDQPVLPLVSTTAHPVIDPERGCLWSVSRDVLSGAVCVIRYDGTGSRVERWLVEGASLPQATHTITQTRDWLVLADTAYKVDVQEIFGADRTGANNPDGPVLLIRKDDLVAGRPSVRCREFRIAPEVNHFYARYDDSDGVEILMEHAPGVDIGMYLRADDLDAFGRPIDPALRGMYCHGMSPTVITLLRFDPATGRITERARVQDPERYWQAELSAIDWSLEGQTAPTVHHLVYLGFHPEAVNQRALANYGDRVDRAAFPAEETPAILVTHDRESLKALHEWTFAADDYPTSPVFIPRSPGAEGRSRYSGTSPGGHDGHLLVLVHNDDRFRLDLFDAADVARGPVASLAPPPGRTVPFMIHAAWMPEARPAADLPRHSFRDDLDHRLDALPEPLREAAMRVADRLP